MPRDAFLAASAMRAARKFVPQTPFDPHGKAFRSRRRTFFLGARQFALHGARGISRQKRQGEAERTFHINFI
jgi:hypothetical protein